MSLRGVGLGFRRELAADLLADPGRVDLLEVVAENALAHPSARREIGAIAEIWPIALHGVKLSLGSADGLDVDRARRLGRLARELRAPVVTEHVAFTRAGGREIGHLTPLPFSREAVRVVARNVAAARRPLGGVPLLLENIAWTLRPPGDEMDEATFYSEVAEATGCGLLLDLANLYANAVNAGRDALAELARYPLGAVEMAHLAGGVLAHGFYLDTHAHAVPSPVFELLARLVAARGAIPVIVERDDAFPPFAELAGEVDAAREILAGAARGDGADCADAAPAVRRAARPVDAAPAPALAAEQGRLATLLTAPVPPDDTAPFDRAAIQRTRAVLFEKRLDEALPLLPRAGADAGALREIALSSIRASARAPRGTAIADARRIADAAAREPRLGDAARRDRLELRSRFVAGRDGAARPRRGPFLGHETLPDGRRLWAVKGLGASASVHLFPKGADR